jgi:hypothetical protein
MGGATSLDFWRGCHTGRCVIDAKSFAYLVRFVWCTHHLSLYQYCSWLYSLQIAEANQRGYPSTWNCHPCATCNPRCLLIIFIWLFVLLTPLIFIFNILHSYCFWCILHQLWPLPKLWYLRWRHISCSYCTPWRGPWAQRYAIVSWQGGPRHFQHRDFLAYARPILNVSHRCSTHFYSDFFKVKRFYCKNVLRTAHSTCS